MACNFLEDGDAITAFLPTVVVGTAERTTVTTEVSTTIAAALFTRLGNRYADSATFYHTTIQFSDCFLGSSIIRHFNKTESTAFVGEFVHNYAGRRYFTILGEKFSEVFIFNVEAQV